MLTLWETHPHILTPATYNNRYLTLPGVTLRKRPAPPPPAPESLRPHSVMKQFKSLALYISISLISLNQIKMIAVTFPATTLPLAHRKKIISCSGLLHLRPKCTHYTPKYNGAHNNKHGGHVEEYIIIISLTEEGRVSRNVF